LQVPLVSAHGDSLTSTQPKNFRGRVFLLLTKHQIKARFVLVGFWNTLLGYGVFILLDTAFARLFAARYIAYMSAMVLSNVVSVLNAFVFHKYVTFRSEARGKLLIIEFLKFSTTYLFTFLLSTVLLPIFVEVFHVLPKVAAAFIIPIGMVASYLGHSRFSFRRTRRHAHDATD
jgi:putative flippase GtrA